MVPFDRSHRSSYSSSIVTMVISCIVCEIGLQRDMGQKSPFFYITPPRKTVANILGCFVNNGAMHGAWLQDSTKIFRKKSTL